MVDIGNLEMPIRVPKEKLWSVKEISALHIWPFIVAIAQRASVSLPLAQQRGYCHSQQIDGF